MTPNEIEQAKVIQAQATECTRLTKEVDKWMDLYEEELILRKQCDGESQKVDAENSYLRARVASLLKENEDLQAEKRQARERRDRYEKKISELKKALYEKIADSIPPSMGPSN